MLIGDNVDVDVDEPAVTVRWSLVACGETYVLPGSEGTHGSSSCGIPNVPLNIYVDGYVVSPMVITERNRNSHLQGRETHMVIRPRQDPALICWI